MEWSNEKSLEFLEFFKTEPCLWNPNLQSHKNRSAVSDAWRRIIQSLSFPVTAEELKKKKDSLMGYYRIHINKYKKSLNSAAGQSDVYTTNWFAFELMDSFLRPIYGGNTLIKTEAADEDSNDTIINESTEEVSQDEFDPGPSRSSGNSLNKEGECTSIINHRNIDTFKHSLAHNHNYKRSPDIINAKKQMDDAFAHLKSLTSRNRVQLDEYDHFAFMIASKIRKLENPDDREILMNSIQNITFEFYMKNKQKF